MDDHSDVCPKCHTIEDHDHSTCDGKPGMIITRWYTYEELLKKQVKKKKVYYVKTTIRPNTR